MANTIRIKRRAAGGSTGAPTSLANAELAYNESDAGNGILYYGYGTGGAGGSATQVVAIGGDGAFVTLASQQTITGKKIYTGALDLSGATVSGFTVNGNFSVVGDLTVSGTTTFVNSTTVEIKDKNLELGKVDSPSDAGADGGGITLLGTTNKTFIWADATDSWTSSEHLSLASGKEYKINGTSVLSATSLGSSIASSSLTTVGTISGGTWQGTAVGVAYGGTGASNAADARVNLDLEIGVDVQAYSAALTAIGGLTPGDGGFIVGNGTAFVVESGSTARTSLGLGTMAVQDANNVAITGGLISATTTISGATIDAVTIDCGEF